ncbi:GIN domain-containing protein [Pedobacter ginsengisoli]|uniref:GIN domain-containing protein n=1 Tax=Pedobacter ginsengisoli TaxID=363852 RepID=UPI0012FDCCC8|nr:DUF2807 domain-containing protein [Pedobacter ginsengisoli]
MIYFSNTANSIHQPRKSNLFILPLLLLLISSCKKEEISPSGKQITETRNPGTFHSISTNSAVNIHISQGDTHSVSIKGSDNLIQHFNTNIVNNELVLSYKQGNILSNDLEIWLTLPSLEKLSTSGSGNIEILGNFNDQESFNIRNTGSANIHLSAPYATTASNSTTPEPASQTFQPCGQTSQNSTYPEAETLKSTYWKN